MKDASPEMLSIFHAALERLSAEDRAAYLDAACGQDSELRERIEALLRAHEKAGGFLAEKAATSDPRGTVDEVSSREQPGVVLAGRYKLLEEIGEGGMGKVWMAQQTEPVKRPVAVKVIKAGMDSKAVLARFEAERQALAVMDHPNIARVLDAGTTESGRPFFVMELVKGIPITQYCDERRLTPRLRLELFVPVCHAIQHAHQKGVIHRDIKPSNVLVALYDDRPVPKVIDFGVAKATGQALTDKTLMTGFGVVVGTPEYMSPEQASLNNLDIDTRSDVYSLGVLLYELLTGTTPVDRKSVEKAAVIEILRIVREVEAPRPSAKVRTSVTLPHVAAARSTEPAKLSKLMKGELDWVLLKALEKDRSRRYETANGLAADIQRYLANEPVVARPPSAAYRLQKAWQRHKVFFLAGAAVAASLVIGIAVSVWQAVRADREARRAVAALDELRASAPAFAEQARALAAREHFDEALQKLDYAARLRPDVPEYLIARGDLLQCQLRLAEAADVYRAALVLRPDDARARTSAELCDELLASPHGLDGKLSREHLSKLHLAMQRQQRPAAELLPVARLLGEEKKLLVASWLERLKDLPVSADRPLTQRLSVREDGLLALDLSGTKVTDLSPLAGAPLAVLNVANAAELARIDPLKGMSLMELNLAGTSVADLSPLEKMQTLQRLSLNWAPVSDLRPLRGQRLQSLDLTGCPVRDITPLRDAALVEFTVRETRVTDLSALAGMPLKFLDMAYAPVTDFSPLARLPLEVCNFAGCQVTDLSFARQMPLRELMLWNCNSARNYAVLSEVQTLELLILPEAYRALPEAERMAIESLRHHPRLRQLGSEGGPGLDHTTTRSKEAFWRDWDQERAVFAALRKSGYRFSAWKLEGGMYKVNIENQPLTDLSILRGEPVRELWLNGCKVQDLTPIQGLPLRALGLHKNPVADIRCLRKMPLEELSLEETKVSDLAPLRDLPLKKLYLHDCEDVTDVANLANITTLEKLTVPVNARNINELRKLPKLKWLAFAMMGEYPYLPVSTAQQFWEKFDQQPWLRALSDAGFRPKRIRQLADGTWEVDLSRCKLTDLSILRGVPIRILSLMETNVTDLEPLRGMRLRKLWLYHSKVTDLRPLAGMPLDYLDLVATNVTDLSALRGMPLTSLRLNDCPKLRDVSPLADCKALEELTLPRDAQDYAFLRSLPSLKRLSFKQDVDHDYRPDRTAAEFWTEYDANRK